VLLSDAHIAYDLKVRCEGKNYRFYCLPGKDLGYRMGFVCSEPRPAQQKIFVDYVHERLVRMAAMDFGSQSNKP